MGRDLRKLNQLIKTFNNGKKSDIELLTLVYKAYLLGLGQDQQDSVVESIIKETEDADV